MIILQLICLAFLLLFTVAKLLTGVAMIAYPIALIWQFVQSEIKNGPRRKELRRQLKEEKLTQPQIDQIFREIHMIDSP